MILGYRHPLRGPTTLPLTTDQKVGGLSLSERASSEWVFGGRLAGRLANIQELFIQELLKSEQI